MRKVFYCFVLVSGGWACSTRQQDFNAFDREIRLHKSFDRAEYDTLLGGCGYWNLTHRQSGHYYQFFEDQKKPVAKGFTLTVDEFIMEGIDESNYLEQIARIEQEHPVDVMKVVELVKPFGAKEVRLVSDSTGVAYLEVIDLADSVHTASCMVYVREMRIQRLVEYHNDGHRHTIEEGLSIDFQR